MYRNGAEPPDLEPPPPTSDASFLLEHRTGAVQPDRDSNNDYQWQRKNQQNAGDARLRGAAHLIDSRFGWRGNKVLLLTG